MHYFLRNTDPRAARQLIFNTNYIRDCVLPPPERIAEFFQDYRCTDMVLDENILGKRSTSARLAASVTSAISWRWVCDRSRSCNPALIGASDARPRSSITLFA